MKKLVLTGIISLEWNDWNRVLLIQEDGYKIDLISRLNECLLNSLGNQMQINYHLSDNVITLDEAKEELVLKLSGGLEAEYQKNDYSYSSWTSGTDYDTVLRIGKHDLFLELQSEKGRFAIFEINYK